MIFRRALWLALALTCLARPAFAQAVTETQSQAAAAAVGKQSDAAGTPSVIGLLKQIQGAAVPAGAATAANQATANGSLATLVARGGGTGTNGSVNAPSLPVVGSNFASSGTYANYLLLGTIAANTSRSNVEVNNTTGQQIIVVRDDGTAANGSAPVTASIIPLAPGAAIGAQGGSWASTTFKGRLQIYAVSAGLFVSTYQD